MKDRAIAVSIILLSASILLVHAGETPAASEQVHSPGSPATPHKRSSSAIALTADGATILVVNPDSNSLSLVDLGTLATVTEIPVGLDPRTVAVADDGLRAYVANRGSDSVSGIDLVARTIITEVAVGDRPYGVVVSPAGDRLYVTEQGTDQLRILDTTDFATLAALPTRDRPSGLAISDDGQTLYVTHLLTNTISIIDTHPHFVYLPLILRSTSTHHPVDTPSPASNPQYPIS